jgi:pimeloyl-ACP methyl ester carboxylesterase
MFHERLIGAEPALNVAVGPAAGPPLLLLHGVLRGWRDFVGLLPTLATRWHVHALDFRGHGKSGRTPGRYLVRDYVDDAAAVAEGLFTEPGVLLGHSLGALVALAVAARLPDKVRALVLEDPPSPAFVAGLPGSAYHAQFEGMRPLAGSTRPVAELTRRLAELRLPTPDGGTVRLGDLRHPTALRFLARCLQDVDPDVFTPLLAGRWLDGIDLDAWAAAVPCPAVILRGNEKLGGMLPRDDADRLLQHLADGTLIDLPQVGHLIHLMDPQTTLRLVCGFLEALR